MLPYPHTTTFLPRWEFVDPLSKTKTKRAPTQYPITARIFTPKSPRLHTRHYTKKGTRMTSTIQAASFLPFKETLGLTSPVAIPFPPHLDTAPIKGLT